jgi:hypothetical protein
MAFIPGKKGRILLGDFSFSAYVTDVTPTFSVDMLETTTMADDAKKFIPGANTSTLGLKGFLDPDGTSAAQYDQINTWTGAEAVTYGPSGLSLGSELLMTSGLQASSQTGATMSAPVSFALECQSTGQTDRGVSLHDLAAETVDVSGTAVDGGAASTTGAVAHLHVTAFSGLTSAVFIVEDSATGSSGWATIGTFTTATALTQERLVIAGTVRRYTRYSVDVTGTGSVTFQVGIARR